MTYSETEAEEIEGALREGKVVVIKADTPLRVDAPPEKVKVIIRSRG